MNSYHYHFKVFSEYGFYGFYYGTFFHCYNNLQEILQETVATEHKNFHIMKCSQKNRHGTLCMIKDEIVCVGATTLGKNRIFLYQ